MQLALITVSVQYNQLFAKKLKKFFFYKCVLAVQNMLNKLVWVGGLVGDGKWCRLVYMYVGQYVQVKKKWWSTKYVTSDRCYLSGWRVCKL